MTHLITPRSKIPEKLRSASEGSPNSNHLNVTNSRSLRTSLSSEYEYNYFDYAITEEESNGKVWFQAIVKYPYTTTTGLSVK
jgi:hypothetical protein